MSSPSFLVLALSFPGTFLFLPSLNVLSILWIASTAHLLVNVKNAPMIRARPRSFLAPEIEIEHVHTTFSFRKSPETTPSGSATEVGSSSKGSRSDLRYSVSNPSVDVTQVDSRSKGSRSDH